MTPAGDLETFEHAYRAQGAYVADILGRLAVPAEAVSDAVQDVFVAAYHRWDDFDPERPVRPWLTGFARRIAFRYRRSAARRHRKGAALVHLVRDRERPPIHEIAARDFLDRFLRELAEGHREAFLMTELEGRSATEVADALGISTEAVYGRVRATRRRLREALLVEAREPDPRAAALVPAWAVLQTRLGIAVPSVVLPALGTVSVASLKTFGLTVGLGVWVLGLVDVAWSRDEAPARPPVAAVEPLPSGAAEAEAPADVDPATGPHDAARGPAPVDDGATASPEAPTVVAMADRARRGERTSSPEAVASPGATLEQETALLRAAKTALAQGRAEAALGELAAHARRFPEGQLADARRRTRIRALCDLGRVSQARGEAQALAQARPGDPLAQQALSICAEPAAAGAIQKPVSAEKDITR